MAPTAYTQTSVAPLSTDAFWVRYSNLLLSVWGIPDVRQKLNSSPADVLSYYDLATVPGATFEIRNAIEPDTGSFEDQYRTFQEGHKTGKYVLVVPDSYPGVSLVGSTSFLAAAGDGAQCCCCCCPCCSCF